jgi:hypothetical protein
MCEKRPTKRKKRREQQQLSFLTAQYRDQRPESRCQSSTTEKPQNAAVSVSKFQKVVL